MKVQLTTDNRENRAGFLASWSTVDRNYQEDSKRDESYVLTLPNVLTIGKYLAPTKMCLQMFNLKDNGKVNIKISSSKKSKGLITGLSERINVYRGNESVVCKDIKLPENFPGKYALVSVEGDINGYKIKSFKRVRIVKTSTAGLIQTDKYDYRPEQVVKIRTLMLNDELRPSKQNQVSKLWIEDPSGEKVFEFQSGKLKLKKGIAQLEYKLSDEAKAGKWTVKAQVDQNDISELIANFEVNIVEKSTLPQFKVTIDAPDRIVKDSDNPPVKICARYSNGASVQGIARVKVTNRAEFEWQADSTIYAKNAEDTVNINGCVNLNQVLGRQDIQKLTSIIGRYWDMEVSLSNSGHKENITVSKVTKIVAKQDTIVNVSSPNTHLFNGLPYVGQVKVLINNEKPANNEPLQICTEVLDSSKSFNREKCELAVTNDQGILKYAIMFDSFNISDNSTILRVTINGGARDSVVEPLVQNVSLIQTNSKIGLMIKPESAKVSCDNNLIKIYLIGEDRDTLELTYFLSLGGKLMSSASTSILMSGNANLTEGVIDKIILKGDSRYVVNNQVINEYTLEAKIDIIPSMDKMNLLAFVKNPQTGETRHILKELDTEPCENSKLEFAKKSLKPGEPQTISLQGPPEAICGYSIFDETVSSLKNPNDITKGKLLDLMGDFNYKKTEMNFNIDECKDSSLLSQGFEDLGLSVMSDKFQTETTCNVLIDATEYENNLVDDTATFTPTLEACVECYKDNLERGSIQPGLITRNGPSLKAKNNKSPRTRPSEVSNDPLIDLKSFFPQTWLFNLVEIPDNGNFETKQNVPETITSWHGEAFCTSESHGFSISDRTDFKVDQKFDIELKLPKSIKRDEKFPMKVIVFNRLSQDKLPLRLRIIPSDDYNTINRDEILNAEVNACFDPLERKEFTFMIQMKIVKEGNVTVEATIRPDNECQSSIAFENPNILEKLIQVNPEGFPIETVNTEFICIQNNIEENVNLGKHSLPRNVVEGSNRDLVTVSGDILAPAIKNIEKLVASPTGSGEQNMLSILASTSIRKYLDGINQNEPNLVAKTKNLMKSGYEKQEETFRHINGSYSIWGPKDSDSKSSIWLTALVVKAYSQASKYIDINKERADQLKLATTRRYLRKQQQRSNGCFKTEGFQPYYQSQSDSDASLTAFVSIATSEAGYGDTRLIGKAFKCLREKVNKDSSLYTKALTAYAYALENKTEEAREVIGWLTDNTISKETEGKIYWKVDTDFWSVNVATSQDVEITAYILLTFLKTANNIDENHTKIAKWLISQQNSFGGFKSTHDTVIALQALSEYALRMKNGARNNLNVIISEDVESFYVKEDNQFLVQSQELVTSPNNGLTVNLTASGRGCVLAQFISR